MGSVELGWHKLISALLKWTGVGEGRGKGRGGKAKARVTGRRRKRSKGREIVWGRGSREWWGGRWGMEEGRRLEGS